MRHLVRAHNVAVVVTGSDQLPDGVQLARTTSTFDEHTAPAGLLAAHRIADGVWGRLVVSSGALDFVVEDGSVDPERVEAGGVRVIPPGVVHHVDLGGPVEFHIEFHR